MLVAEIEDDTTSGIGEGKTVARRIDEDRRGSATGWIARAIH